MARGINARNVAKQDKSMGSHDPISRSSGECRMISKEPNRRSMAAKELSFADLQAVHRRSDPPGQITNDDFEEGAPETADPAIRAI